MSVDSNKRERIVKIVENKIYDDPYFPVNESFDFYTLAENITDSLIDLEYIK